MGGGGWGVGKRLNQTEMTDFLATDLKISSTIIKNSKKKRKKNEENVSK